MMTFREFQRGPSGDTTPERLTSTKAGRYQEYPKSGGVHPRGAVVLLVVPKCPTKRTRCVPVSPGATAAGSASGPLIWAAFRLPSRARSARPLPLTPGQNAWRIDQSCPTSNSLRHFRPPPSLAEPLTEWWARRAGARLGTAWRLARVWPG